MREHYPGLTGTGEDTLLASFVARADGLMAGYCGFPRPAASQARTLEAATYVSYLDGPRLDEPRILDLPVYPVVSVTSVYLDASWDYGAAALLDPSEYELVAATGELYLPGSSAHGWIAAARAQKVTYVAGYSTAPPDLVAITALAVRHLLDQRHAPQVLSSTVGGVSQSREAAGSLLPPTVRAALDGGYALWGSRVG